MRLASTMQAKVGMTRLDKIIELNNLRPVFAAIGLGKDLLAEMGTDFAFANVVRRTLLGPARGRRRIGPSAEGLFPPFERRAIPALAGKRIGLVASGGAGAMASIIGVKRAFEEAGLEVEALSACSGAVLFASLWSLGFSADEMARFWLGLEDRDYIDPDWGALGRLLRHGLRGWAGLLRGDAIQRTFELRGGAGPLRDTRIPLSAVVWNIDENRVEFLGTRQTPDLSVARAARVAISIPILVEPVRIGEHLYGDGGIIDILPVQPLLEEPEPLDAILGINCYYAEDFRGEDVSGWHDRPLAVLRPAVGQLRWAGHLELAREHVRALGSRLTLIHPVPYDEVRGAAFYRSFLDRSAWPRYIRLGYEHARAALARWETHRPTPAAIRPEPLGHVDSAWLRMERPDNPMTVTSAMLFAEPLDHGRLLGVLEKVTREHPRFRQRIHMAKPTEPCWELFPSVDVGRHVTRATLPAPGDDAALGALIGELESQPLDRSRPLWQVCHVEGYRGGSAVVTRLHHAIGDGAALIHLLLSICDDLPPDSAPREPGPILRPSDFGAHKAATALAVGHLLALPPDPKTSFKGALSTDKRVGWSAPLPLERLRAIAHVAGATTNDVLLAALAGALARSLEARNEKPDDLTLHALVPVNLRADGAAAATTLGNQFGLVYAPLPLGVDDPLERLRLVARRMTELKKSPEAAVSLVVLGILGSLPPALYSATVGMFGSKASLVVTNVPGPKQKLSLAGQPIRDLLVWAPVSSRLGLGVSLLSYAGSARVGIVADANVTEDPQGIVRALEEEVERLARAVEVPALVSVKPAPEERRASSPPSSPSA